jgi:hypothetical protein
VNEINNQLKIYGGESLKDLESPHLHSIVEPVACETNLPWSVKDDEVEVDFKPKPLSCRCGPNFNLNRIGAYVVDPFVLKYAIS